LEGLFDIQCEISVRKDTSWKDNPITSGVHFLQFYSFSETPMRRAKKTLCAAALFSLVVTGPAGAMDSADYGEFQKLMQTPLQTLTEKAGAIFAQKYPQPAKDNAQLDGGNHPGRCSTEFDFNNASINIAYCIAGKKPELLAGYPCYNPVCEQLGFANLAGCFFTNGKVGDYSLHASSIDTCVSEATLIFLWDDMGASHGEIIGALRFLFDPSVHETNPISP